MSVDDVSCIGVQIESALIIDFGLDDQPEDKSNDSSGLNIRLIIHVGLPAKYPYLGDMLIYFPLEIYSQQYHSPKLKLAPSV